MKLRTALFLAFLFLILPAIAENGRASSSEENAAVNRELKNVLKQLKKKNPTTLAPYPDPDDPLD